MSSQTLNKFMMLSALAWTLLLGFLILSPGPVIQPLLRFNFFDGMDKVVHFCLFFGFAYLWISAFTGSPKIVILVLLLSIFMAAFTEYLQLFIEGRHGETRDVYIDSAGAIIGLCFAMKHSKKRRQRRVRA